MCLVVLICLIVNASPCCAGKDDGGRAESDGESRTDNKPEGGKKRTNDFKILNEHKGVNLAESFKAYLRASGQDNLLPQ
ncbi:MAG TPA: hypothetical protein V6D17_10645 [Candidatus Obscuribacterales bacterium]